MLTRQTGVALESLEKGKKSKRDYVLYLLDKGMLLRMQGKLSDSNAVLEQAKPIIQQLEAISIREQAAATTVNDSMRSYLPPFFEQVMLHCVEMINSLELQDYDAARVEAMQLDTLYQQNDETLHPAIGRYISGIVFEANHEPDNALIAYRKAYEIYQRLKLTTPKSLQQDLLRLTQYLGLNEEFESLQNTFQLKEWPKQNEIKNKAKVTAFVFNGLVPRKHSQEINVQSMSDGQLHRISTPFYEKRTPQLNSFTLQANDTRKQTVLADKLDVHAEAALSDAMPAIIARTLARVSVKNRLVDNTREQSPLASALLNIATFVTEVADTRAWYTLPQQMLIAQMYVEPGQYDLQLNPSDATQSVTLQEGEEHFMSLHWPDSHITDRRPNHDAHITPVYSIGVRQRMR